MAGGAVGYRGPNKAVCRVVCNNCSGRFWWNRWSIWGYDRQLDKGNNAGDVGRWPDALASRNRHVRGAVGLYFIDWPRGRIVWRTRRIDRRSAVQTTGKYRLG